MPQVFYAPKRSLLISWGHRASLLEPGALSVSGSGSANFAGSGGILLASGQLSVTGSGSAGFVGSGVIPTNKRKYHNWSIYGARAFVWQNASVTPSTVTSEFSATGSASAAFVGTGGTSTPTPDTSPNGVSSQGAGGWVAGGRKARRKKIADQDEKDLIAIMAFIASGKKQ